VIRREIRRGNKQKEDVVGRSRAQNGAGAACIVAFPPSPRVLPIRSGEGGTADSTPSPLPLHPSPITAVSKGCVGSSRRPPDGGQE